MKYFLSIFLASCVFFASAANASLAMTSADDPSLREGMDERPSAEIPSQSAYLFDVRRGETIVDKDADRMRPLASLTKLMTALVVYESRPAWDEPVIFLASDRRAGNIPYIGAGEEVTRGDLWNLALAASSNDAVVSLVRSLGFSEEEFARRMNDKARSLGLARMSFKEPTGLDAANAGTAREMAALARVAFAVPEIREALLRASYTFAPRGKQARRARATNAMLMSFLNREPYRAIAGKTGFIEESKYNLVFGSGRDGRELIGVILGSQTSEDRFQSMKDLMYRGFENKKDSFAKQ